MFSATRRYREDRCWLEALFGGGGGHVIRDQMPWPFAAYGRVFPPVEITHYSTPLVQRPSPAVHRWSELAAFCGVDFTPATTWPDLERAICATGSHGLYDVGRAEIDNTVWDLSATWRTVIGKALNRHDHSNMVFYGVWDGHGTLGRHPRSPLPGRRHFGLPFRGYYVWSGGYEHFGTFCATERRAPVIDIPPSACPQDLAWPESRTWCYLTDTDWSSVLIGGPRAAIDELVRAREVEVLEIDGDTPSMVLSAL